MLADDEIYIHRVVDDIGYSGVLCSDMSDTSCDSSRIRAVSADDEVKQKKPVGFTISDPSFRRYMVLLRLEFVYPKPPLQVVHRKYAMRESPAGEESQVDMGQIVVKDMYGKSLRLYIFAMVLSCSQWTYKQLLGGRVDSRCHRTAEVLYGAE